ncbi:hypothetical protein B0H15DRAFT_805711 [Mycena belliarum]|uniref:Uncharacterized protein n=1 Tax=Mycena belliarum TaxID=1033014 RepID=A0AAD6TQS8_9AGAR|nr:hypothetical protein B0H15DRAFT_805711 [Mycena belliae]
MAQKKRERKRIPRANRKNLRLWAEGARETVLRPHFDAYVAALDKGRVEEHRFCKSVCREFHARIDWKTPDSEEPIVADWDPLAPTVNEVLPEDEEVRKRARIKELNKFMHECYQDKVAPIVEERWAMEKEDGNTRTKDHKAGFRAQVARDIFRGLPAAEQDGFASRAKDEAAHAKAAYAKALNEPPSTSPEARQRCISHISDFMGPILKGLHDRTGLHATIILGGPMPQLGGELRTVQ